MSAPENAPECVHVLTICHREGATVSVHSTRAGAEAALAAYVAEQWPMEMPPERMDEPPDIEQYFRHMEDKAEAEEHWIATTRIEE
ncbi:MAG: hypothetical protein AAGI34_15710 [Pseudomonadota bacterium]